MIDVPLTSHDPSKYYVGDTPIQQVAQYPLRRTTSSDYRAFRVIPGITASRLTQIYLASKKAFLTRLTSTNIRSREFSNILAKTLASQEDMNTAMSLQGDDVLILVDVLDQVSRPRITRTPHLIPAQALETPNVELDLRRKCVRILRRVCSSETILPRSCILSDNISKEGDAAIAPRWPADVWNGRHNGERVCIKVFHACTAENLPKIKQVRSEILCVMCA